MMSTYDAELFLSVSRQRGAELRAAADHHRLARAVRGTGHTRAPWWRLGRSTQRGPDWSGDSVS